MVKRFSINLKKLILKKRGQVKVIALDARQTKLKRGVKWWKDKKMTL